MFEVVLAPEAQKFFADADQALRGKLARCFQQLERDPRRHNNIKRLSGALVGRFRYRVGDWRVIYQVNDRARRVHVSTIAHRREVYE